MYISPTAANRPGLASVPARIRSVPLACHARLTLGYSDLIDPAVFFIHLRVLSSGSRIANTKCDLQFRSRELAMLGELTNIPTDTLIDMLYVILAGEVAISAGDAAELEQIQRELQRRGGAPHWSFGILN